MALVLVTNELVERVYGTSKRHRRNHRYGAKPENDRDADHLTSHEISCREPAAGVAQYTLATANTLKANVRLAPGRLHRLVTACW